MPLATAPAASAAAAPANPTMDTPVSINPTGGIVYTAQAGEPIGSQRVVRFSTGRLWIPHPNLPAPIEPVIGITQQAAQAAGDKIEIVRSGLISGFVGLTPGASYFLAKDGLITATPPHCGWFLRVGVAQSTTELFVTFSPIVFRGVWHE